MNMRETTSNILYYGLWALVLVIALVLQVIPLFLVVTMLSLAVGIPKGAGLVAIPMAVVAMVVIACIAATRYTRRYRVRPVAPHGRPDGEPGWRAALASKSISPSEYFRNLKRLG